MNGLRMYGYVCILLDLSSFVLVWDELADMLHWRLK